MTRAGCPCSTCHPADPPVAGGPEVRCPSGHATVQLSSGRDRRGLYLQARCTTPGRGAKQLVRQATEAA